MADLLESEIFYMVSSVEASVRASGHSAFIIDFNRQELIYRSEKLLFLDQASDKDIKRKCLNPYFQFASDETYSKVKRIHDTNIRTLLDSQDYLKHVCILDFPIVINGHKLIVNQKVTPLISSNDGNIRYGLFQVNFSNMHDIYCLLVSPSGKRFKFDFNQGVFVEPAIDLSLSSIELEILRRSKMGMTNEDISESLFLSVSTIKTHKMKVYKKLKVDNISSALAELENFLLL